MGEKKKFSPFDKCSCFVCLRRQNSLSVLLSSRTWTFDVDKITFKGVSGSKQNLVGVFYVWNVSLVLKSKVKLWSWTWSWSWTEFWFFQKRCGATPNLVDISNIWRITFPILILNLVMILKEKKLKKKFAEQNWISWVSELNVQNMNIRQKERFFFHSCDYNTFSFYIFRMW